jgi:hypothetical protein
MESGRALHLRHRVDHRHDLRERLVVELEALGQLAEERELLHQLAERAHLPHELDLVHEVVEGEVAGEDLLRLGLGGLLVDVLLEVLDEADDVAEPEDAGGEPLGAELLEAVERLAHAEELDGLAGDLLDGEGRAAAGVAVELREDEAVEGEAPVELRRGLHGVLADHRVGYEEDVLGGDRPLDLLELDHELLVDGEAAGGVVDDRRRLLAGGRLEGVAAHLRGRDARLVEHRDAEPLAEHPQLIDGGRPVHVRGDEEGALAVLEELARDLSGGGRLPGALEPDHHDAGRAALRAVAQRRVDRAHEGLELVVADLDEVVLGSDLQGPLAGLHLRLDHLADGLLADAGDEALHDLERDVRLEERDADVPQRVVHHLGGDLRAALELVPGGLEALAYGLEHGSVSPLRERL